MKLCRLYLMSVREAGPGLSEETPERKKRRRPQVDYKALDEKLKAQEAQTMQTS